MARFKLLKRVILNKGAYYIACAKLLPLLFRLGRKSVVIDCGANVGNITRLFACTGARVYAFEPDKNAFAILSAKFKNHPNVTLINKGVWDKNDKIALYFHQDQLHNEVPFTVGSSIKSTKLNIDESRYDEIEVIDFSEFVKSLNCKVDLVKMDVEGAETDILKSVLEKGTYTFFHRMYVETHETKIPEQKADLVFIRERMEKLGVANIKLNWI